MMEEVNNIKCSKHPYSHEIYKTADLLEKIFHSLLIAIGAIGFIAAIVASTGLAEWADNYDGGVIDVPVNFFGYYIELESDTLGGSAFAVFFYIIIFFALISLVLFCVKSITIVILNSKAKMLDSLYHSEKLTELFITYNSDKQTVTKILRK